MSEKYEVNMINRYHAGAEAIRVLEQAGFAVFDADINVEDVHDPQFTVEAELGVKENKQTLKAFDDGDEANITVDLDVSDGFAEGIIQGFMAGYVSGEDFVDCDRDDCPRQ